MNSHNNRFIVPSLIMGGAIILSVLVFGMNWKAVKKENQTITVTGSAKKEITSDLGILRGTLALYASTSKSAYDQLNAQKPLLVEYLRTKGFPESKVEFSTYNVYPQYQYYNDGRQGSVIGYHASQMFSVQSKDVNLIKEISLDISSLLSKGVDLQINMPEYYYTKLADVKIDIQAEAARDAKMRAEKIAASTGSTLGVMRSARMGVLQITPVNSNMISDYGMNDVTSIEKEITAVINASFEIQ
jgi:hypothetical protein